jgi:eukaryotic-like serine/threonine-protein kinase
MPSITDSIGRVLGDRYRLVTPLGTGASSHVYLAEDVSLHRQVAIKVLHPGLADDRAFLKRFQTEAHAVAVLNHPNILQVYDWGEQDGIPYLVLEFLAGGSLRQVYDTGALLTLEQAAQIGIEAAAGLDYAHRRGLVHRDIKPANLLFDADQRLRIADFGLARALAEASWTEPVEAMLGTARYAAPEQFENWVLNGKADVYALALVLYEGVTGAAPFVGDNTTSTRFVRVGALLPEHEALGPLYDVLVWAAAPEPTERYDASQLRVRLEALAASLPKPEPLPIAEAGQSDLSPGMFQRSNDLDLTELGVPSSGENGRSATSRAPIIGATPFNKAKNGADDPIPTNGAKPYTRRRRRRSARMAGLILLVCALIAGAGFLVSRSGVLTPSPTVPQLVGKSLTQATGAVRSGHFVVKTTGHAYNHNLGAGLILTQHPAATAKGKPVTAKQGSTIEVVVSLGQPPVTFPTMTNLSCAAATRQLDSLHLVGTCPTTAAQYSSSVPADQVISTSPAGTARYGSTVTITVSKGHAPVPVPNVTGSTVSGSTFTYPSARTVLTQAGFAVSEKEYYSSSVPNGAVISTVPSASAGPQPFGSPVTVNVSLGPEPVRVPDVSGDSATEAASILESHGLHVAGPYGPPRADIVVSTDPSAGTSVPVGSTVDLYTR